MITLYSGTPGSGKSLHMSEKIFDVLNGRKDRLIIANFEIDLSCFKHPERFFYLSNLVLQDPDLLYDMAYDFYKDHELKEGSILLFIDESQLLFNSRDWHIKGRRKWLSFFTQHRKFGFDVFLVSQFDMMLDKQIRSLIEYQVIHRKVTNFGTIGSLLKLLLLGNDIFVAVYQWYGIKQVTGHEFFIAWKKYYSIYDTFKQFELVTSE